VKLASFLFYAACLGASLAQSAVAGPAGGMLAKRPIVLRWDRIARSPGVSRVRLSSLRLVSEGEHAIAAHSQLRGEEPARLGKIEIHVRR